MTPGAALRRGAAGLGGGLAAGLGGFARTAGWTPFAVELLEVFPSDQPVAAVPLSRKLLSIHVAPQRRSCHAELFSGYGDRQQLVTSFHVRHGTKPATVRIGYHGLAGSQPIGYNSDTKVTDTLVSREVPLNLDEYARERLEGVPSIEQGPYTRALNAVRGRFPTVESVRSATDEQLRGHGLGTGGLAYLRELVEQDGAPAQETKPPVRLSDQTVGPPWEYDERFRSIAGRKRGTGGKVTVASLRHRTPDDERLYYPLTEQADTFGRGLAAMLNERQIFVPDPR